MQHGASTIRSDGALTSPVTLAEAPSEISSVAHSTPEMLPCTSIASGLDISGKMRPRVDGERVTFNRDRPFDAAADQQVLLRARPGP